MSSKEADFLSEALVVRAKLDKEALYLDTLLYEVCGITTDHIRYNFLCPSQPNVKIWVPPHVKDLKLIKSVLTLCRFFPFYQEVPATGRLFLNGIYANEVITAVKNLK
jgi:hypothetical protein